MADVTINDLRVTNSLSINDTGLSAQTRSSILKQDANAVFPINFGLLRVWDAFGTNLPATAATDDLGLSGGTFGTSPPVVSAGDCKALGATTRYARVQVALPECYDAAESVAIQLSAGMVTTIADTSCTVDVQCYRLDKITGISTDLCATAATSMNSLVFASIPFTITPGSLTAGDVLDVRIAITCTDGATATAVTPTIAGLDLLCDIKG